MSKVKIMVIDDDVKSLELLEAMLCLKVMKLFSPVIVRKR